MKKLFVCGVIISLVWLSLESRQAIQFKLPQFKLTTVTAGRDAADPRSLFSARPLRVQARELPVAASLETSATDDFSADEIEQFVANVILAELPAALDALDGKTDRASGETRKQLLRRWAENDPAAAAKWAGQFPEGDQRNALFEQVAVAWADSDLAGATEWSNHLPEGASRPAAIAAIAYEAARTEPLLALELAVQLPATPERNALLTFAVSQWAADNFSAAAKWAEKIADAGLREEMLATLAVAASSADAPAAANLVAGSLAPGDRARPGCRCYHPTLDANRASGCCRMGSTISGRTAA
ncbi:MAG: hypothetical protein QM813_17325 [Verrucomicrobiota bacterium]